MALEKKQHCSHLEREKEFFTATRERIQRDRIDPDQAELFPNNYFTFFSMER